MKNIFLIFSILLIFSACGSERSEIEEVIWDKNKLISYIEYASDDITEVYRDEFEYNPAGLPVGSKSYLDGVLSGRAYNYLYDGNKRTYHLDSYLEGGKTITTRIDETFLDGSFSPDKLLVRVNTVEDEVSREEYIYDNNQRETGYKVYYFKSLDTEYNAYSYDDGILTSVLNIYSDGESAGKRKVETDFFGDECLRSKVTRRIQFLGETSAEYIREEYSYDNKGREVGYKSYYLGNLTNEQKDYVYDDIRKELTFDLYSYSQHIANDETTRNKIKILFY